MPNEQTSVPLFASGEVLTAANMNISAGTGVPVFATTVTRDAAFGGASEKALAEGQLCYLSSTNVVQYYDGAAWATVGPSTAGGLTFITGATFTTATSFSLPNSTFTSTYKNYKILISITAAVSNATFTMRMRASGSDDTNNVYNAMFVGVTGGGGTSNVNALGGTSWNVGQIVAPTTRGNYGLSADIITPQAAASTSLITNYLFTEGTDIDARAGAANFITATQFDSLSFISSVASNITGTYRVYGYTES